MDDRQLNHSIGASVGSQAPKVGKGNTILANKKKKKKLKGE